MKRTDLTSNAIGFAVSAGTAIALLVMAAPIPAFGFIGLAGYFAWRIERATK